MVASKAKTVVNYLAELPPERRKELATVLATMRKRMPKGYQEGMGYGMIMWSIPLAKYPVTYNGYPLCYAALAAQKNYSSLYLMGVYGHPERMGRLKQGFADAGKKVDMGKACIRFARAEDLPLGVIGDLVAEVSPATYIAWYEKARESTAGGKAKRAAKAVKGGKK